MSGRAYRRRVTTSRTFIVRVTESPSRVVIEDVRTRRRAVARDLTDVGAQIAAWLALPGVAPVVDIEPGPREDSVSPPP